MNVLTAKVLVVPVEPSRTRARRCPLSTLDNKHSNSRRHTLYLLYFNTFGITNEQTTRGRTTKNRPFTNFCTINRTWLYAYNTFTTQTRRSVRVHIVLKIARVYQCSQLTINIVVRCVTRRLIRTFTSNSEAAATAQLRSPRGNFIPRVRLCDHLLIKV